MSKTTRTSPTDALIIGAGPAGLACASGLARLLHPCIVFSSQKFRNEKSQHMHGILTWEHRDPAEYRAAARKDLLAHYDTISFEDISIAQVEKLQRPDGSSLFRAVDERGSEWWGRKLVIATGVGDIMLNIEGYEKCWGTGIFHCLFCHGYEERGSPSAGILAIDDCSPAPVALHLARFANRLADKVVIYTNGNDPVTKDIEVALSQCKAESKTRQNISIEPRKINRLVKGITRGEVEVYLEGGEKKTEGFLSHKPKSKPNGGFATQLDLETTLQGDIKVVPPFNETSVPGVFSGGDAAAPMKAVVLALAHGASMAAGLAAQIEAED